ncbi:MAG TPA: 7TM diverse intracellular signaling domain-containing protein, partial [Rectinemataceae bacterium]|nr:7TM diverse intracellular signaling domain-containing protein [Rectinemataceae bacterium]
MALSAISPLWAQASQYAGRQPAPGTFDLSGLPSDGYSELSGLWDFWPNEFVEPEGISRIPARLEVRVPSHWNELTIPGLSSVGYGSYHLRVTGLPSGMTLGLKLTSILSAARVFADGKEVLAIGRPSSEASAEAPRWDSRIIALSPRKDGSLDVLIQVSNHVDFSGGLAKPVILGAYEAVADVRESSVVLEMFEIGALFVIGFYCLILFAFRPKDRYTLFFGLLALTLALRTLFYDEFLILTLFPNLPFAVLFRIGYLSFAVPFFLLAGLFRHLMPRLFPPWLLAIFSIFTAGYGIFVLLAPMHLVSLSLLPTEGLALVFGAVILSVLVRALAGREAGAFLVSFGFILFLVPVVHDILVTNGPVRGPYLTPIGMISFFLTLAFMITRNFALALDASERLADKLAAANGKLSSTIEELNRTQDMLLVSEKLNSLGKLAAGLAHEINTPLAAVISANESARASLEGLARRDLPALVVSDDEGRRLALKLLTLSFAKGDEGELAFLDRKSRLAAGKALLAELPALADRIDSILELGLHSHRMMLRQLSTRPDRDAILDAVLAMSELRRSESIVGVASEKAADVVRTLRHYLGDNESHSRFGAIAIQKEMEAILVLYRNQARKGVDIVSDFAPGLEVRGDRQNLGQV